MESWFINNNGVFATEIQMNQQVVLIVKMAVGEQHEKLFGDFVLFCIVRPIKLETKIKQDVLTFQKLWK